MNVMKMKTSKERSVCLFKKKPKNGKKIVIIKVAEKLWGSCMCICFCVVAYVSGEKKKTRKEKKLTEEGKGKYIKIH